MPLSCELGFHEWEWQYLKQNSCDRQLVCAKCRTTKGAVEVSHKWEWQYLKQNSCDRQLVCARCHTTKGDVEVSHEWEWIPRNACMTEQVCKRCGTIGQADEKEHIWRRIYRPDSAEIRETCELCGTGRAPSSGLATFVGQETIKKGLIALIAAAKKEEAALDHLLLCGSPGMRKATFAKAIADEMGVNFSTVSADSMRKEADLATILTNLHKGDVLLIDEVHRIRRAIREMLYPALDDFALELVIGKAPSVRNIRLRLPPFTLVGTTSKLSQVDPRLRHAMIVYEFSPYDIQEMSQILLLQAAQQKIAISLEAAVLLAQSCGGIPATASVLLKRVHKHAIAFAGGQITSSVVKEALASLGYGADSQVPDAAGDRPYRGRPPIPDDVKVLVWQRDGGRCVKCGSQENLEFDHIIPLSIGGSNTARNLQLLCEKCNRSKGATLA